MKKNSNISNRRSVKPSRRMPIPDGIRDLLEVANYLPADIEMPEIGDVEGGRDEKFAVFKAFVQSQSKDGRFKNYIGSFNKDDWHLQAYPNYGHMLSVRKLLGLIANLNATYRSSTGPDWEQVPFNNDLDFFEDIHIDRHGELRVEASEIVHKLKGADLYRIRLCEHCKKAFFWAGRNNQWCHNDLCSQARRSARHREKIAASSETREKL